MADTNVKAGVLFHVVTTAPKVFSINGLNDASIEFSADTVDSETIAIQINFTISKAYLTKEDIILQRPNTNDLGHFPFKKTGSTIIDINNLKVELVQAKPADPVTLKLSAILPDSKVGGAKVGGAPLKVGGAGL